MCPAPVPPVDAATVLLLRDGPGGPEVYLQRRAAGMAFAGGMYAYPGGAVDPRDGDAAIAWAGPAAREWAGRMGVTEPAARALVCAAVRETFEECGVLLAGPSPGEVVTDLDDPRWETERLALERRRQSLSDLLACRHLVLRSDLLRPWARWITPEAEPRRYDARFFVAALPAGQATRQIGGEADRVLWIRPAEALGALDRGEIAMLPPTAVTLAEIAPAANVAEVLAAALSRPLDPVRPRIVLDGGTGRVVLPGEEGYG